MKNQSKNDYLVCEQKIIYALLMASAGMMGAYTYVLRGGVLCNAQTANVVVMAINFGKGDWLGGLYFLNTHLGVSLGRVCVGDFALAGETAGVPALGHLPDYF